MHTYCCCVVVRGLVEFRESRAWSWLDSSLSETRRLLERASPVSAVSNSCAAVNEACAARIDSKESVTSGILCKNGLLSRKLCCLRACGACCYKLVIFQGWSILSVGSLCLSHCVTSGFAVSQAGLCCVIHRLADVVLADIVTL